MSLHAEASKITLDHLSREAVTYIRQSTYLQVQHNTASTARQYNMVDVARQYGWSDDRIVVVDQDQGITGALIEKREGWKWLISEIVAGRVGAILCVETSRLARDPADWQQLLKLCALTSTLIIDEGRVYDPRDFNDKLMLDMQGMFNGAELRTITSRSNGGKMARAKQGKLRKPLPPGYVYCPTSGQIILDPDEKVQALVRLLFEQFEILGSAMAVARYFAQHQIKFPTHFYDGKTQSGTVMAKLRYDRVIQILHNPAYAGIYVYGRTTAVIRAAFDDAGALTIKKHYVGVRPEDWPVAIPNSHEGYITEEQLERNEHRLRENIYKKEAESPGAVREGAGLLQGIVRCGVCGGKMYVRYPGRRNKPVYMCGGSKKIYQKSNCVFAPGLKVDPAVSQCLLESVAQARAEASSGALEQFEAEARRHIDLGRARVREVEREAEQAERLYLQVASENGRVKAILERKWEEATAEVEQAKRDLEAVHKAPRQGLGPKEKESLLKLTGDLPALWSAPTTSHRDRKELLRLQIKDVVLLRVPGAIKATVRWQSGGRTELEIPWLNYPESHTTDPTTIEIIRRLALTHTDKQIAEHLNEKGIRPLLAKRFGRLQVWALRKSHHISGGNAKLRSSFTGQREDGRFCPNGVARMLDVPAARVYHLCKSGKLDAVRSTPHGKLWIRITPEEANRLKGLASSTARRPALKDI